MEFFFIFRAVIAEDARRFLKTPKLLLKTILLLFMLYSISFLHIFENFTPLITPLYGETLSHQSQGIIPIVNQQWFFGLPSSVAVDSKGDIYVLNQSLNNVYKYSPQGQFIKGWGKRGSNEGEFSNPVSIAVALDGYVYVADTYNNRVQIFSPDGDFIQSLGKYGGEEGEFYLPCQITFDRQGNFFVVDKGNNRVQKFSAQREFITSFGGEQEDAVQFYSPHGVAVDSNDNLYVSDFGNSRIIVVTGDGVLSNLWYFGLPDLQNPQPMSHFAGIHIDENDHVYIPDSSGSRMLKYSGNGDFITEWGASGNKDGNFSFIVPDLDGGLYYGAVTSDSTGRIIVADTYNNRLQTFTQNGDFLTAWSSGGNNDDQFHLPFGLTLDSDNNIYIVDCGNDRVQIYSPQGIFKSGFGKTGSGNGEFNAAHGIDIDSSGNIYVADTYNHRIQVFSSQGSFIRSFGTKGLNDGELNTPFGIAINSADEVFVADSQNARVQKFSNTGEFISIFGDPELTNMVKYPMDIAIDAHDNIYILDVYNHQLLKFSSNGNYLSSFGNFGNQPGQFKSPQGIAIDSNGNIAVSDTYNHRIQIFDPHGIFIESFGELGFNSSQLNIPSNIEFDSNDKLYVAENLNNRVQIFSKPEPESEIISQKAIIVAGGGGYEGNALWQTTQMCANYAYRVLTFQGYTKDAINYLSSDSTLDLDGNGFYDDVDNDATNNNLFLAITEWAEDADELLVYITDHGGDSFFRMSQTEVLGVEDLDLWLDSVQTRHTKQVTFIYDACQSGSFLDKMKPPQGKQRVAIASASKGQEAYFTSHGSLSFSYIFWGFLMNGMNLFDAFISTKNSIEYTYQHQNPIFDDNGNGVGNEDGDGGLSKEITLGRGIISAGDMPDIGAASPQQILYGESAAQIFAENITDADGTVRVWAVITPPDFSHTEPDEPVLSLPTIELNQDQGNDKYQGSYSDFSSTGTYNIAVFAMDTCGTISFPKNTSVIQMGANTIESPPQAPLLSTTVDSTGVTISWSISDSATGYELYYAPYPQAENIGSIDMGTVSQISFDLTKGVGFYVAVKAYNDVGSSDFSNICVIIM